MVTALAPYVVVHVCRYDQKRGVAIARDGEQVHLLGAVREVLRELHTDPKWVNSQVWLCTLSISKILCPLLIGVLFDTYLGVRHVLRA